MGNISSQKPWDCKSFSRGNKNFLFSLGNDTKNNTICKNKNDGKSYLEVDLFLKTEAYMFQINSEGFVKGITDKEQKGLQLYVNLINPVNQELERNDFIISDQSINGFHTILKMDGTPWTKAVGEMAIPMTVNHKEYLEIIQTGQDRALDSDQATASHREI